MATQLSNTRDHESANKDTGEIVCIGVELARTAAEEAGVYSPIADRAVEA